MNVFEITTQVADEITKSSYHIFPDFNFVLFFESIGSLATALVCFLTYRSICLSRKQFEVLHSPHIIARLEWDSNLVLLVLENTGLMLANNVKISFDDWFDKELENLNASCEEIKDMIAILKTNHRPIHGHTKIAFGICKNKEEFAKRMRSHKCVKIEIVWDSLGKKEHSEQEIDLVDEIVLEREPISKIARTLSGIETIAKDLKQSFQQSPHTK